MTPNTQILNPENVQVGTVVEWNFVTGKKYQRKVTRIIDRFMAYDGKPAVQFESEAITGPLTKMSGIYKEGDGQFNLL